MSSNTPKKPAQPQKDPPKPPPDKGIIEKTKDWVKANPGKTILGVAGAIQTACHIKDHLTKPKTPTPPTKKPEPPPYRSPIRGG